MGEPEVNLTYPGWREVPQAVFFSWSKVRQLDYCMRRDLATANDSTTEPGNIPGIGRDWFLERAGMYKEDLNILLEATK